MTEDFLVSSRDGAPCTHAPVRLSCKRAAHANATRKGLREADHRVRSNRGGGWVCQGFLYKRNYTAARFPLTA